MGSNAESSRSEYMAELMEYDAYKHKAYEKKIMSNIKKCCVRFLRARVRNPREEEKKRCMDAYGDTERGENIERRAGHITYVLPDTSRECMGAAMRGTTGAVGERIP